jgi:DNA-binding NarL/FixJ family response regulator
MDSVRVALVENHDLVRVGIRLILESIGWIEVVAEADDAAEALELIRRERPKVVLIDISLPGMNGLELIQKIREMPETQTLHIVMLTVHTEKEYVWRAMRLGAEGYVVKDGRPEELELAIKAVISGQMFVSPQVAKYFVTTYLHKTGWITPYEQLSQEQRRMLQLVAQGYTNKQLAEEFHLGIKMVETQRAQLMHHLGFRDVTELVRFAIRMGLVTVD